VADTSNIDNHHFYGSGWSFPVSFSAWNHQLDLAAYEENVNNAIQIILLTNKGERSLEPEFGAGLQQFTFRKMDQSLRGENIDAVKFSLLQDEPRITVKAVEAEYTGQPDGLIRIRIAYVLNKTNTRHNFVFPFYLKEGTNLRHHP
jgi:phage baseplate assembly protein W